MTTTTAADVEVPPWAAKLLDWFEPKIAAAIAEALRLYGYKPAVELGNLSYRFGTVSQVFDDYVNVILDGAQALDLDAAGRPVPVPCTILTPAPEGARVAVLFSPSGGALMLGPFVDASGVIGTPTGALLGSVANVVNAPTSLDTFGGSPAAAEWNLRSAGGTESAPTALTKGAQLGRYAFAGYGTAWTTLAAVKARAAENFSATAGGTDLVITTTPKTTVTPIEAAQVRSDQSWVVGNQGAREQGQLLAAPRLAQLTTVAGNPVITGTGPTVFTDDDVGCVIIPANGTYEADWLWDTRIVSVNTTTNQATLSRNAQANRTATATARIGAFGTPLSSADIDFTGFKSRSTGDFIGHYAWVGSGDTATWDQVTARQTTVMHLFDGDTSINQDTRGIGPRGIDQYEGHVRIGPNTPLADAVGGPWINGVINYENQYNEFVAPGGILYGVVANPTIYARGATGTLSFGQVSGFWSNVIYDSADAGSLMEVGWHTSSQITDFIQQTSGDTHVYRYTGFMANPPQNIDGGTVNHVTCIDVGAPRFRNISPVITVAGDPTIEVAADDAFFAFDVGAPIGFQTANFRNYFIKSIGSSTIAGTPYTNNTATLNRPLVVSTSTDVANVWMPTLTTYTDSTDIAIGIRNAMPTVWVPDSQTIAATGTTIQSIASMVYAEVAVDAVLGNPGIRVFGADNGQILEIYNVGPGTITYTDGEGVALGSSSFTQLPGTITTWRFFSFGPTWTNRWVPAPGSAGANTPGVYFDVVADYGADKNSIIGLSLVATSISADTFTKTDHGLVNDDYVILSRIATTTGIGPWPNIYRVINATANTFKLSATSGGAAINLATGDGTVTVYGLRAVALATNNSAFARCWADTRAARGYMTAPDGNYAISPGIIATDRADAGILFEKWRSNLWLFDAGADGDICIDVAQTNIDVTVTPDTAVMTRQPSIEGMAIYGTFCTGASIGFRYGGGLAGHSEMRVRGFVTETGTNGVTGKVGSIGILCQNHRMTINPICTVDNGSGSAGNTITKTAGVGAFSAASVGKTITSPPSLAGRTITAVADVAHATVSGSAILLTDTTITIPEAGDTSVTEAWSWGPGTRVIECFWGMMYDRHLGHWSCGYQDHPHTVFRDCATAVCITNGAWVYGANLRWELVTSDASGHPEWTGGQPFATTTAVRGVVVEEGSMVTADPALGWDPRPGSRIAGQLDMRFEANDGGSWTTSVKPGVIEQYCQWQTEGGAIDTLTACPVLAPWDIQTGAVFTHDGPKFMSPAPSQGPWLPLMKFSGDINTPLVNTVVGDASTQAKWTAKGNWALVLQPGTPVRWLDQSFIRHYGAVDSRAFSSGTGLTTVTMQLSATDFMDEDPLPGSMQYWIPSPQDLPTEFFPAPALTALNINAGASTNLGSIQTSALVSNLDLTTDTGAALNAGDVQAQLRWLGSSDDANPGNKLSQAGIRVTTEVDGTPTQAWARIALRTNRGTTSLIPGLILDSGGVVHMGSPTASVDFIDAAGLSVDASGDLWVGPTAFSSGTPTAANVHISATGASSVVATFTSSFAGSSLDLVRSKVTALTGADSLPSIRFEGTAFVGPPDTIRPGAGIGAVAETAWSATVAPARLTLLSNRGGTGTTVGLALDHNGNVHMGSPTGTTVSTTNYITAAGLTVDLNGKLWIGPQTWATGTPLTAMATIDIDGATLIGAGTRMVPSTNTLVEIVGGIHVANAGNGFGLAFVGTEFNGLASTLDLRGTESTSYAGIGSATGGSGSTSTASHANRKLGSIHIGGDPGTGGTLVDVAEVNFIADALFTGSSTPTRIEFGVNKVGDYHTRTLAMTINSDLSVAVEGAVIGNADSTSALSGGIVRVRRSRSGGASPLSSGDVLGYYQFYGHDSAASVAGATISAQAAQTWVSGSAHGTKIVLQVVQNGATSLTPLATFNQDLSTTLAGAFTAYDTAPSTKTASYDMVDIANDTAFTNNAASLLTIGVNLAPTITYTTAVGAGISAWRGFADVSTHQASTASRLTGTFISFHANPTFKTTDTFAQTVTVATGVLSAPTLTVFASGGLTVTTLNHFQAAAVTAPTGATITTITGLQVGGVVATGTVTTRKAINIAASTGAGLVNEIGIDIAALTAGTTLNIGIRNAATTVFTPSAVQSGIVNSSTIACDATVVHLTSTAARVLSSTPHVTAGQDGQILVIVNDNTTAGRTITFSSNDTVAGSALSLNSATLAIGPGGALALVYSVAHSKWLQIGANLGSHL